MEITSEMSAKQISSPKSTRIGQMPCYLGIEAVRIDTATLFNPNQEQLMFQVKDIMTTDVFTLNQNDSLSMAKDLMDLARIRHIPIIDNDDNFVGLLTHRDILAATVSELAEIDPETQDEIEAGIPIHEIMQTDVMTVTAEVTLRKAAQLLLDEKFGCLPVVSQGKLSGIITEADFLRLTIDLLDAVTLEDGNSTLDHTGV